MHVSDDGAALGGGEKVGFVPCESGFPKFFGDPQDFSSLKGILYRGYES